MILAVCSSRFKQLCNWSSALMLKVLLESNPIHTQPYLQVPFRWLHLYRLWSQFTSLYRWHFLFSFLVTKLIKFFFLPLCCVLHIHHIQSTLYNCSNRSWIWAFRIARIYCLFLLPLFTRSSITSIYLFSLPTHLRSDCWWLQLLLYNILLYLS